MKPIYSRNLFDDVEGFDNQMRAEMVLYGRAERMILQDSFDETTGYQNFLDREPLPSEREKL